MNTYLFFIAPLFITGVIHHFLIIKNNLLGFLAKPVDIGLKLDKKEIFGKKKTFRGFIVVTLLNGVITHLYYITLGADISLSLSPFLSGALAGFLYSLFELPNSFLKRRLGIPPSAEASGILKPVFRFIDQSDSVLGAVVAANIVTGLTIEQSLMLFLIGTFLHLFVDTLLYKFSYKKVLPRR